MTDANVIFNNNSFDNNGEEQEFQIDEQGELEHDFSELNNDSNREYLNIEGEEDELSEEELEELENENISEEGGEVEAAQEKLDDNVVVISKSKIILIEKLLKNIKESNDKVIQLLGGAVRTEEEVRIGIGQISDESFSKNTDENEIEGRVIEGVFDGENMIGPDGKQYSMPANYASKSKLIEGDIMKLTITDSGTFVYKQIGPIERRRVLGIVGQSENGNFFVMDENGKKWRVLTASVTYYKGQAGDEAVILVPKNGDSKWAAVDNVVRNQE